MGPVSLTGDGLVLGAELGAVVHRIQNCLSSCWAIRFLLRQKVSRQRVAVQALWSYLARTRFSSITMPSVLPTSSYFQEIVPRLRQFDALRHQYPNVPCYLIFDAQYLERYSFANQPVGTPVPGFVAHSDSTRELGAKLGIDFGQIGYDRRSL